MTLTTMYSITAHESLSAKAQLVLTNLVRRSNKEDKCFPGLKRIAADCKISVSSVQRALRELLEHGLIKKVHNYRANGSQTSNIYTLISDKSYDNKEELPCGNSINASETKLVPSNDTLESHNNTNSNSNEEKTEQMKMDLTEKKIIGQDANISNKCNSIWKFRCLRLKKKIKVFKPKRISLLKVTKIKELRKLSGIKRSNNHYNLTRGGSHFDYPGT